MVTVLSHFCFCCLNVSFKCLILFVFLYCKIEYHIIILNDKKVDLSKCIFVLTLCKYVGMKHENNSCKSRKVGVIYANQV